MKGALLRMAGYVTVFLSTSGCMPIAGSYGQLFPSQEGAEMDPMYGVHFRAVGAGGDLLGDGIGLDMKVQLIDAEPTYHVNMTFGLSDPIYLFGGGGVIGTSAETGDPWALGEAGVGLELPLLVDEVRDGLHLFAEGGYFTLAREEADSFSGPLLRAGLMFVP